MHSLACRALDRIHLLDGNRSESRGIHRVACIDHFSCGRALDDDAVHSSTSRGSGPNLPANRGPAQSGFVAATLVEGLTKRRTGTYQPASWVFNVNFCSPGRSGVYKNSPFSPAPIIT